MCYPLRRTGRWFSLYCGRPRLHLVVWCLVDGLKAIPITKQWLGVNYMNAGSLVLFSLLLSLLQDRLMKKSKRKKTIRPSPTVKIWDSTKWSFSCWSHQIKWLYGKISTVSGPKKCENSFYQGASYSLAQAQAWQLSLRTIVNRKQ